MSDSLRPHGQQPSRLLWGFSRQECWSRLPYPPLGDLPDLGFKPRSPTLQADSLPSETPGKPILPLKFILCSKHHIRLWSHSLRSLQGKFQICYRHFLLSAFYTRGILLGALQRIFIFTKKEMHDEKILLLLFHFCFGHWYGKWYLMLKFVTRRLQALGP